MFGQCQVAGACRGKILPLDLFRDLPGLRIRACGRFLFSWMVHLKSGKTNQDFGKRLEIYKNLVSQLDYLRGLEFAYDWKQVASQKVKYPPRPV